MNLNQLTSVSPIDGRYYKQTSVLGNYFSEFGLIRYRLHIEIEYFIALVEMPLEPLTGFNQGNITALRDLYRNFSEDQAKEIKEIELVTNHDVKAVEYFLKKRFDEMGIGEYKEFIHFGLTSQDINNTSIPLSIKEAMNEVMSGKFVETVKKIEILSEKWKDIPMLARTHGQPASPTRLGKELNVFNVRLQQQLRMMETLPFSAKFGGATGNMNAHFAAFPNTDWHAFADRFVNNYLGLLRSFPTTQIEHYDNMAALFDNLKRVNTILIDMCRDMWQYISMGYFTQKIKKGEVGSSAMPHKVNPIDFENAEGNLGMANALFEHLSAKLPISRLQRDLTDSTVLRNIGIPFAHTLIALSSMVKGLDKLELNKEIIEKDLNDNWAVVAEAIQNILRREGVANPYEQLKELTRKNVKIGKSEIHGFIDTLAVPNKIKNEMKDITPHNYLGK